VATALIVFGRVITGGRAVMTIDDFRREAAPDTVDAVSAQL
jgi:hypothetical protein